MSLQLRANSLDQLRKLLVEYSFCRILSVEDRASAEASAYEVTLDLDADKLPLAFRTKICRHGHTLGYSKQGPVWRCIECRRVRQRKNYQEIRQYREMRRQELLVNGN